MKKNTVITALVGYLFGAAMQLNRMGYHMTKMNR